MAWFDFGVPVLALGIAIIALVIVHVNRRSKSETE